MRWDAWLAAGGALAATGVWARRAAARDAGEYLDGGRRASWVTAGLALAAAEVSALTVVGAPAAAFARDWTYLQFFIGAVAARAFVAWRLAPLLLGRRTPYEYLGERFGPLTRRASAAAFIGTRGALTAVRLLAAASAAGALLGCPPAAALALIAAAGAWSLADGGAPSAARAGAVQTAVVLAAGALTAVYLLGRVDGGPETAWALAASAGKLRVLDLGQGRAVSGWLGEPPVLWAALVSGFLGSAAAFGVDHEMTQKLMILPDAGAARRAMALSTAASLAVLGLYLGIGTLLFVFYKQNPGLALPDRADGVFGHFAATVLPAGLRGLTAAAVVLSTADLPLASLSCAWACDLRAAAGGDGGLRSARRAAWLFAALLAAGAWALASRPDALAGAAMAAGVAGGPLLGLLLLAATTRRSGEGAAAALLLASALGLALLALTPLPWSWTLVAGCAAAYGLGRVLTKDA